ncbi:MAG: hydrogenase nickel incorporation protein HypB [Candidatus Hodarchaeales archaeon]|jgi:hydrogenase nickel incorporation protein HypB
MPEVFNISVDQRIQEENDKIAEKIRQNLSNYNIPMIDIMGSVGSGKTSILEYFSREYSTSHDFLVINGDLATDIDAQRISKFGSKCIQINTGRGCHLMAFQVDSALKSVDITKFDFIFVENVGNLICPSSTDVGAQKKITVTSVTEGPYVFRKHPITFKMSDLAVLNKIDLASAMEIDIQEILRGSKELYPQLEVLPTSVKNGSGMKSLAKTIGIIKS